MGVSDKVPGSGEGGPVVEEAALRADADDLSRRAALRNLLVRIPW
jgi:hypothetical protein